MKTLHISVADKIATYQARDGEIVCGNSDYQIQFAFDSEWDSYTAKTAVFKWNFQYIEVPFTGDTCAVPIIRNATSITVGVYAGDLCTTTEATIGTKRSVLCNMGEHADPPEDVYNQLMKLIGNIHGETPYIGENGNWWIGEEDTGVFASGGGGIVDLPLTKGDGENSIVIDEGTATGANSIAGGTTDINLVKSVLGEGYAELIDKYGSLANMPDSIINLILNVADVGYTASEFKRIATVSPTIAEALLSISYGASNKSKTAASISLGFGNIAGAKGYYITEINTSQKTITLSTKQSSTVAPPSVDWSVGDRLFIVNDDRYWVEIASKNGNVITLVDMPFSSLEALKTVSIPLVGNYDITNPTERSVINIDKPESGAVDIGWGAIAIGSLNQVLASCGYGVGFKNIIAGEFGASFGQENLVGYSAFSSGIGNKSLGRCSFTAGDNLTTTENGQSALGKYNKNNKDALLMIGNGYAGNESNALEVLKDGTVVAKTFNGEATKVKIAKAAEKYQFKPIYFSNYKEGTSEIDGVVEYSSQLQYNTGENCLKVGRVELTAMGQGTADAFRNVWFSDSDKAGRVVYNNGFQYNPAIGMLKVGGSINIGGVVLTTDSLQKLLALLQ